MKIRHPWLIRATSWTAAWVIRCGMATISYRYRPLGPNLDPGLTSLQGRYIYAFWHENMLLPVRFYSGLGIRVLISQHADGQMIAEVCERFGFRPIRGSSTRGGVEAVRQMLREGQVGHLAITPDGPRGPRRKVQPGVIYLAARTGLPIVPAGFGSQRPWRLESWDRFAIPRPFTRGTCVTLEPIRVPGSDHERLEPWRQQVEWAINRATELAEQWAESGKELAVQPAVASLRCEYPCGPERGGVLGPPECERVQASQRTVEPEDDQTVSPPAARAS